MHVIIWAVAALLFAGVFGDDYDYYYYYDSESVCGNQTYDGARSMCCDGNVLPRSYSRSCCGSASYDRNENVCCQGAIHRKSSRHAAVACCGSSVYAYNRYICCEGTVRPKLPSGLWRCCGSSSYDAQLGICCQGTVYWRPSSSYECCGSLLYNRDIQTCVDGRVQMTGECTCDASSIAIQATTVSPLQSTPRRRPRPVRRRRTTTGLPQL